MDLSIELGPKAQKQLGKENISLSAVYNTQLCAPALYDTMTFFIYGKENVFTVVFRRWDMDENGKVGLTLGLELND